MNKLRSFIFIACIAFVILGDNAAWSEAPFKVPFGFKAAVNRVSVNDLHATILQLLGIDHTKLTYRYNGRDFRLTDVAGNVVKEIIA